MSDPSAPAGPPSPTWSAQVPVLVNDKTSARRPFSVHRHYRSIHKRKIVGLLRWVCFTRWRAGSLLTLLFPLQVGPGNRMVLRTTGLTRVFMATVTAVYVILYDSTTPEELVPFPSHRTRTRSMKDSSTAPVVQPPKRVAAATVPQ